MFVARVAVLVARVTVTHYECLEFPRSTVPMSETL
jgi:hypothetical protein